MATVAQKFRHCASKLVVFRHASMVGQRLVLGFSIGKDTACLFVGFFLIILVSPSKVKWNPVPRLSFNKTSERVLTFSDLDSKRVGVFAYIKVVRFHASVAPKPHQHTVWCVAILLVVRVARD